MSSSDEAVHWARSQTFEHAAFSADALRDGRELKVSVCLPAREESATIGAIVAELAGLREQGAIDEVVVIDAGSGDGTAAIARAHGARVYEEATLRPELGPVLGKGDAMWRALSVLSGDVVCYLDADTEGFGAHFATGLIGPLLRHPELHFVKASYRRPLKVAGVTAPEGGGRVNDLMARPLLARFYPDLSAVRQPLAGEFAARRELLEALPFFTGYGVEIGLLIDAYARVGLEGLAQVDLGVRQNRHQPLHDLGPMAFAVLGAVCRRLEQNGRLDDPPQESFLVADGTEMRSREVSLVERPPVRPVARAEAPAEDAARPAPARIR